MADLDNCTDEELTQLAASETGRRKRAIAQEILRRRRRERWQRWLDRHGALAEVVSWVRRLLLGERE